MQMYVKVSSEHVEWLNSYSEKNLMIGRPQMALKALMNLYLRD